MKKYILSTTSLISTSIITINLLATPVSATEGFEGYNSAAEISTRLSKGRKLGELNYMQPFFASENHLPLLDLKVKMDNYRSKEINLGLVYRYNHNDNAIFGIYGYYDYRKTGNNFAVNGLTTGAEILTKYIDGRANFYLPENKRKKIATNDKKQVEIHGTSIFAVSGGHKYEYSLKGYDIEIGTSLLAFSDELNERYGTKLYFAKYDFRHKNTKPITGNRIRFEHRLAQNWVGDNQINFNLTAETQYDKVRKRQNFIGLGVKVLFDEKKKAAKSKAGLNNRMMETVIRDVDIVTESVTEAQQRHNFFMNGKEVKHIYYVGEANQNYVGSGTKDSPLSIEQLKSMNIDDAIVVVTSIDSSKGGKQISAENYKQLQNLPQVVNGKEKTRLATKGEDEVALTITGNKVVTMVSDDVKNTSFVVDNVALAPLQEAGNSNAVKSIQEKQMTVPSYVLLEPEIEEIIEEEFKEAVQQLETTQRIQEPSVSHREAVYVAPVVRHEEEYVPAIREEEYVEEAREAAPREEEYVEEAREIELHEEELLHVALGEEEEIIEVAPIIHEEEELDLPDAEPEPEELLVGVNIFDENLAAPAQPNIVANDQLQAPAQGEVDSKVDLSTLAEWEKKIYALLNKITELTVDQTDNTNKYNLRQKNYERVLEIANNAETAFNGNSQEDIINEAQTTINNENSWSYEEKNYYKDIVRNIISFSGEASTTGIGGQQGVGTSGTSSRDITAVNSLNRLSELYGILDADKALELMKDITSIIIEENVKNLPNNVDFHQYVMDVQFQDTSNTYKAKVQQYIDNYPRENITQDQKRLKQEALNDINKLVLEENSAVNLYMAAYRMLDRIQDSASGLYTEKVTGRYNAPEALSYSLKAITDLHEAHKIRKENNQNTENNDLFQSQKDNVLHLVKNLGLASRAYNFDNNDGLVDIGGMVGNMGRFGNRQLEDNVSCAHGTCVRITDSMIGNHSKVEIAEHSPASFADEFNFAASKQIATLTAQEKQAISNFNNSIDNVEVAFDRTAKKVDFIITDEDSNVLQLPDIYKNILSKTVEELDTRYNFLDSNPKLRIVKENNVTDVLKYIQYIPID